MNILRAPISVMTFIFLLGCNIGGLKQHSDVSISSPIYRKVIERNEGHLDPQFSGSRFVLGSAVLGGIAAGPLGAATGTALGALTIEGSKKRAQGTRVFAYKLANKDSDVLVVKSFSIVPIGVCVTVIELDKSEFTILKEVASERCN